MASIYPNTAWELRLTETPATLRGEPASGGQLAPGLQGPALCTGPPAPRSVPPSSPSLVGVTAPGDHTQPWASCPGGPTGRSRLPHLFWRPGELCSARVPVGSRPILWEGPLGLQPAPGLQPRCFILQTVGSPTWSQNPTGLKEVPDAQWLVRGSPWEGRALLTGAGGGLRFALHSLTLTHFLSHCLTCSLSCTLTHSLTHKPPSRAEDLACCCGSSSLSPTGGTTVTPTWIHQRRGDKPLPLLTGGCPLGEAL